MVVDVDDRAIVAWRTMPNVDVTHKPSVGTYFRLGNY